MSGGHTRLKQALVLRDGLAGTLGLRLEDAIAACAKVEDEVGALRALEENHWRDAIRARCEAGVSAIESLDTAVKDACAASGFTPRYAQYLALLLFARWVELRFEDEDALLAVLNNALDAFHMQQQGRPASQRESIDSFTANDLQTAAFWMATAAGKTHVLHACLAMLAPRKSWSRIFLVTPSEALSRQHAIRLRALRSPARSWNVFVYPDDGDAAMLAHLPVNTIVVLDINKLGENVSGEGQTLPLSGFTDGANLVFVDEGHKGQKSEASLWKRLQRDLAGIGSLQAKHRGLLLEFSATFGQVAEAEHAFAGYAKSVVFDYAYDRFHADRYGKDFLHVRLDGQGDASDVAADLTLAAALLAYWWQRHCYADACVQERLRAEQLQVADPLWVLLGLHVIGGKNAAEKEQTADVVGVLQWLHAILSAPSRLADGLAKVKQVAAHLGDRFPEDALRTLIASNPDELAGTILASVFGWTKGDKPQFRTLSSASGELGLGLSNGANFRYYGVVNVGDPGGLKKVLEESRMDVSFDAFTPSLFARLGQNGSGLNLLIGSRRFAEGWDNYRASSMTLLRLGQSEGSLIVQMFGRAIRLAGVNGDGRRLAQPDKGIAPLQTAYIFGLKSKYLEDFIKELKEGGIEESESIECDFHPALPIPHTLLRHVQAHTPEKTDFRVEAVGDGWLRAITSKARVSVGVNLVATRLQPFQVKADAGRVADDITPEFKNWLPWLDFDALNATLIERRCLSGRWNLRFDLVAIRAALQSDKYTVEGVPGSLTGIAARDKAQRLAAAIIDQLFGKLYRKRESARSRYLVTNASDSLPKMYRKEKKRVGS
ncbi:MAG: DEAD/DEAH box helicase family protein [Proteobacteria bacterium]|nr:DEAD/DEAH box helicase family protein [Pseudomonadota bacterium]